MSEYRKILETRLALLKTDYITTLTNIERVEKDLNEAKVSTTEILGSIKTLELLLVQFNKVVEEKPIENPYKTTTETTSQKQIEESKVIEEKIIIDKRKTPKKIKNKIETNREK